MRFLFWPATLIARIVVISIGLALLVAGAAVSLTILGAIVGIPLAALGLLLILRGLF